MLHDPPVSIRGEKDREDLIYESPEKLTEQNIGFKLGDKVVIFEDTDGDGKHDKRTVFLEGLNLASGIEVGAGHDLERCRVAFRFACYLLAQGSEEGFRVAFEPGPHVPDEARPFALLCEVGGK